MSVTEGMPELPSVFSLFLGVQIEPDISGFPLLLLFYIVVRLTKRIDSL